ncbi:MAG: ice-binding family protein [Microvirga sp.]
MVNALSVVTSIARCGPLRRAARSRLAAIALAAPISFALASLVIGQELSSFAILAGQAVSNTGPTTINGNIGVSPGSSVTGSGSITLTGAIFVADAVALQAQNDLTALYNFLALQPASADLSGQDLGSFGVLNPLTPGVYNFASSAQLTGTLVLDAQGDPDAVFIFNIDSTLTTASGSSVVLVNGAQGGNVFFRVGSSATLGTGTTFVGQIVALTSITLQTNATILCGAALARNGAVTLDTITLGMCVLGLLAGEFADLLADAAAAGEGSTGVAFATTQGMGSFLDLVTGGRGGQGMRVSPGGQGPTQDNTVSTLGYWEASVGRSNAFDAFDDLASGAPGRTWDLWMSSYGGYSFVAGDAISGSHDRTTLDYGVAGGVDFLLRPGAQLGMAVGFGGTHFALADEMGTGSSGVVQVAVHGRAEGDAEYVSAGLAYSYSAVHTSRQVTIAGIDQFEADFGAQNFAGQIEAGYRMEWLTPYVGVRGQAYVAPGYSDTTVSGASTYALSYAAQTMYSVQTELGLRADWTVVVGDATEVELHAGAAWQHDFLMGNSVDAYFLALGTGSTFTVVGATPAADALLLNAGAAIALDNDFVLAGSLDGAFAENAVAYGGSLTLSHSW